MRWCECEGVSLHLPLLQVQHSKSIVVVGGGSAGVEMAAEIKTEYPETEVGERPWRWAQWSASSRAVRGASSHMAWEVGLPECNVGACASRLLLSALRGPLQPLSAGDFPGDLGCDLVQ